MKTLFVIMLAISPAALWQSMLRETNSHAAAKRGMTQYSTKRFEESAQSFTAADKLSPSPRTAFDLGTAQVAAGKMTEGSATLARAMKDPALRADALFNRGNSALAAKAYEYAVKDYVDTLKLRPADSAAKRNLEIALERLQQMKQSKSGQNGQQQQPSPSNNQSQQQAPSAGQKEDPQQADAEALLRSVQQQEQEELSRMKKAKGESVRVGW